MDSEVSSVILALHLTLGDDEVNDAGNLEKSHYSSPVGTVVHRLVAAFTTSTIRSNVLDSPLHWNTRVKIHSRKRFSPQLNAFQARIQFVLFSFSFEK